MIDAGTLMLDALRREGTTHLFSLGGGHINPTWWAAEAADDVELVHVRHEAAAVYAAEGWALATGEPGVAMVTAGPGVTNAMTGLATAHANGSPVVCLAGAASRRSPDSGEVESLDQLRLAEPVTKWARRIEHLDRIPEYVAAAFRHATSGRPGPVYLEVGIDDIHGQVDEETVHWPPGLWRRQRRLAAPDDLVADAAEVLARGERPVVLAGSGVWWSRAADQLRAFVEHARIPVVTRRQGRGTVPDDHELCFGFDWQTLVHRADTLLVVGTQLDYFLAYANFDHLIGVVQVDVDPGQLARNRLAVDVGLVADAASALEQLTARMGPCDTQGWLAELTEHRKHLEANKATLARSDAVPIHPLRLCAEIAAAVGDDATIVTDGSNNLMWTNVGFAVQRPGRFPQMGPLGTIGHGVGYAIGAACARRGEPVLWVVGDGSFGFHTMELDTAARFGLPIVTVIMNNGGWSTPWIPLGQRAYEQLAPGFGGRGWLVERPEQIRPALDGALADALGDGTPSILNVLVDPNPPYFAGRFA